MIYMSVAIVLRLVTRSKQTSNVRGPHFKKIQKIWCTFISLDIHEKQLHVQDLNYFFQNEEKVLDS